MPATSKPKATNADWLLAANAIRLATTSAMPKAKLVRLAINPLIASLFSLNVE